MTEMAAKRKLNKSRDLKERSRESVKWGGRLKET